MRVDWDQRKAAANFRKHGVDFADAAVALEDQNALTIEDPGVEEQRFKSLALGPNFKVLLVVYAVGGAGAIRSISARKADRAQTGQYFQGISE